MLKIVLIAVLFNTHTGELSTGMSKGFETTQQCEEFVKANEPEAPMGFKWYHQCINPSLVNVSI